MVLIKYIVLLLFAMMVVVVNGASYNEHGTEMEINNRDLFEIYRPNVYIVDLRKEANLNKKLIFTCRSGPKSLDLNLTFTGFTTSLQTVLNSNIN